MAQGKGDAPQGGRSGSLAARTLPVHRLDAATREAMWRVFERYYADVTRETFERDLADKQHVILLTDTGDGSVQGFSTLTRYRRIHEGRSFIVIFSGDTILEQDYWGKGNLQNAFGAYITRTKLAHPFTPVYWFLISKGYKTYLLLARNFREHWPRHDRATPSWEQGALAALAAERFGEAWRPDLGVVRFPRAAGRVREGVAPIEGSLLADPQVAFFARANPGHHAGDELACLARIEATSWMRFIGKRLRRRLQGAAGRRPGQWAESSRTP